MDIETFTHLLYGWLGISLVFPAAAFWLIYRIRKLKRDLAKQDNTTRHLEEMLYAAKDGYLTCSIYKEKEYQFCSRRLATLLNLKNGENSTYNEVLSVFEPTDQEQLNISFNMLKQKGYGFEIIAHTKNNKTFVVTGTRINSVDQEVNSDCLWFRDITETTNYIAEVTEKAKLCKEQVKDFRILIDNIPYPVWLRDKDMKITILNRHYLNLLGLKDFKDLTPANSTLHDLGNTTDLFALAKTARESNTPQKKQINILSDGDLKRFEITETPYYDSSLKTSHIIGSLTDITAFDEAKRNYRVYLDSHLDILSSLDTAFCIINTKHTFTFGNTAFLNLWNLPQDFFDTTPHYNQFLDKIRETKILPEVADFRAYKEEENKTFDSLTEQKEDLLYIPDGRTFRRICAPHPDGTIIAYEDITEHLATTRKLSELIDVQKGILNNIDDSVLIFSPNLKLKFYNPAYLRLWGIKATALDEMPNLRTILDMQKEKLPEFDDWDAFRENMQQHITSCTSFNLKLKNKHTIKVTPIVLADTSLMIAYHKE